MSSFLFRAGLRPASVLVTCLAIVAASTAVVAAVIAVSADRLSRQIAEDGLRHLARDVSSFEATALRGPVRFRKAEDAQALLDRLQAEQADQILGGVVVTLDDTTLASVGAMSEVDRQALIALATSAIETAMPAITGEGFWIAKPIFAKENVIGSVALAWTPETALARISAMRSRAYGLAGIVFLALTLTSGLIFRQSISVPLRRLARRTTELADRELDTPVPGMSRADEIGLIASQLDVLRARLKAADIAAGEARFQSAGFQGASVPLVMTTSDFRVTHMNAAFRDLLDRSQEFSGAIPRDMRRQPIGAVFDPRGVAGAELPALPLVGDPPVSADIECNGRTFKMVLSAIRGEREDVSGYVMEWTDVSDARRTKAVLMALEASQVHMDFDGAGRLTSLNATLDPVAPEVREGVGRATIEEVITCPEGGSDTAATAGEFRVYRVGADRMVSGILTPVRNARGKITGHVFLGHDVTESETGRKQAEENRGRLEASQRVVVDALSGALNRLAAGDLSVRIDEPFPDAHEDLRLHFNASIAEIEGAVAVVRANSGTILNEAGNIAGAADNLSRRTEHQAATLEEFAASLTQLTASVASTADGAGQASDVVTRARDNAEASGAVVEEAVTAMSEIESSSGQISRIIGVIDDIAFQTNLLALNAGVEAARAGDAGRGFAVVASEVRALAQRSSDAAREINALISSSSQHVSRGVSLVGKTGAALGDIVLSIGNIAEHVTAIAASAREQSTGLGEINTAMAQLDEATQENVAMFEETTAATHTLREEATALAAAADRFTVGADLAPTAAPAPFRSQRTEADTDRPGTPTSQLPPIHGALALSTTADEDDWRDF